MTGGAFAHEWIGPGGMRSLKDRCGPANWLFAKEGGGGAETFGWPSCSCSPRSRATATS